MTTTDQLGPIAADADPEIYKIFWRDQEVSLRRKFKGLKFLRLLSKEPAEALDLILAPGEYDRLEDVDMDVDDLTELMQTISDSLVTQGNSGRSRRS